MKRDNILIAGIIGGVSTISGEIITKILVATGFGENAVYELNSMLVTLNRPSMLIGFLLNFIVGSSVGGAAYLLFHWLGTEHLVLKSMFCSLMLWVIFEFAFSAMIEGKYFPVRPIADYLVHIVGTAAFGLTMGLLLKAYIFNKKWQHGAREIKQN